MNDFETLDRRLTYNLWANAERGCLHHFTIFAETLWDPLWAQRLDGLRETLR